MNYTVFSTHKTAALGILVGNPTVRRSRGEELERIVRSKEGKRPKH